MKRKTTISPEDAEEFTQTVALVVAGNWRQIALANRMGVPQALGLTTEQWVHTHLGGYVKMASAERFVAAAMLKAEGRSQREIASALGVDEKTVRRDAAANAAGLEPGPLSPWELSLLADATAANAALTDHEVLDECEALIAEAFARQRKIVVGGVGA